MGSGPTARYAGILRALHALEDASQVSNVESKDLESILGRENWKAGHNPDILQFLSEKRGHMEVVDAGLISRLSTAAHELDTMSSILQHLTNVATELRQQYTEILDPIVSKLSKSVSRLPDDILAMAFKLAVRAEGHRGGEQARRLSHVSRRFRKVALAECDLWTTLCSSSAEKELEMLISRSGSQMDLHIFIHVPTSRPTRKFVETCSPSFSRWKTMKIGNFPRGHHPDPVVRIDPSLHHPSSPEMQMIFNSFEVGDSFLPRLQELNIECMHHRTAPSSLVWKSPNLRSLRCAQYLPLSSAALSSLTTFSYTLHFTLNYEAPGKMQGLLDFLPSLTNLIHFELELGNNDDHAFEYDIRSPASECPSIRSFHLRLLALSLGGAIQSLAAQFLHELHFPNLEDYSLSFDFLDAGGEAIVRAFRLEIFAGCFLPNEFGRSSSRLTTLSVQVSVTISRDRPPGVQEEDTPLIYPIYIDNVPTVSTLNITSRSCAVLIRDTCAAMRERYSQTRVTQSPCPSQLQEIRFIDCEDMEVGDLQNIVRYLKKDGYWEQLDRVTMKNCGLLKYEDARQVLREKDLVYSQSM